jgi:hypothetical protein
MRSILVIGLPRGMAMLGRDCWLTVHSLSFRPGLLLGS